MGSASAKAVRQNENDILRNARSVLSRRATARDDPGVLGMAPKKKIASDSYDENSMNEMSKVLNVSTSYDINKLRKVTKKGEQNAHVIRYHRDHNTEQNKRKGIVKGRAQISEQDLIDIFDKFRDEDAWEPTKTAEELNISVDEVISLMRAARLPYYVKEDGDVVAI